MVYTQVLILALACAGVANAGAVAGLVGVDAYAYPRYQYNYGVSDGLTGDHKSASEVRDGGVVKGSYSLLQPDGITRTVNYVADPINGFQAQVLNSGAGVLAKKVVAAPVAAVGLGGIGYGAGIGGIGGLGYGAGIGGGIGGYGLGGIGYGAGYGRVALGGLGYGAGIHG